MPDLSHTLQGSDLGLLKQIAGVWGIELDAPDVATAMPLLIDSIHNQSLVHEIIDTLPEEARYALKVLLDHDGKLLWAQFCRRFGELRSMGPAKRDRQRPDINPSSTTEVLWYRGLIGKVFLNIPPEPQEYAYIPDDIIEYLPLLHDETPVPPGRPASPVESHFEIPANDQILDDACTLLAALRMETNQAVLAKYEWRIPVPILQHLLFCSGLIDARGMPKLEETRAFLEAPRNDAFIHLVKSWLNSTTFNELRLLPDLIFEGDWINDSLLARHNIIEMVRQVPGDGWWNISSFIHSVKERNPDFQRPAGDYDSWFIRQEDSETYLRGFESWEQVDGALIQFMITGPLHWLGFLDLAAPSSEKSPQSFRSSSWAPALWQGKPPQKMAEENDSLRVNSNGIIQAPRLTPRSIRYQISRFCEWDGVKGENYRYRLTPASLKKAQKQNLKVSHLLSLFKRSVKGPLSPNLIKALEKWGKHGTQAKIQPVILLIVDTPEALEALKKTRSARFLVNTLNQTTVEIKPEGIEAIRSALIEAGYLADIKTPE